MNISIQYIYHKELLKQTNHIYSKAKDFSGIFQFFVSSYIISIIIILFLLIIIIITIIPLFEILSKIPKCHIGCL
jgi:uncharacterized membrane protein